MITETINNQTFRKTFRITSKSKYSGKWGGICFGLDEFVSYKDGIQKPYIICVDRLPYNDYQVGDTLEINVFTVNHFEYELPFSDTYLVRKFSSAMVDSSSTDMVIGSTTITREHGLAIARGLDSYVDQSGGTKEYTASIEVQDDRGKPIKFSISSKRAN